MKKQDRCELVNEKIRGEIAYIGKVPDLGDGYFVGIQLDEPFGNINGSFNGVKYFDVLDKYGIFKRPDEIEVDDFPEEDIDEL